MSTMNIGDAFEDAHGETWVVDALLGRGAMARSWLLTNGNARQAVLRTPLHPRDFPDADNAESLARATADGLREYGRMLAARERPFLPELLDTIELSGGRFGLLLPRYPAQLESRLRHGEALPQVVDLLVRTVHQLTHARQDSADALAFHGNLRPTNILVSAEGDPILADPLTPSTRAVIGELQAHAAHRVDYRPPESDDGPTPMWDTWAICQMLYRACSAERSADDPKHGEFIAPPRTGLGKVALSTLKESASARLRSSPANKRFAGRATTKLAAVLNRGLSPQTHPSPPYRFETATDLLPRLAEVDDLIHPAVESVSTLRPGMNADNWIFQAGVPVEFSVNVGTTAGVTAHEDILCGVHLRDLDATGDGRVQTSGSRFTATQYPTGRWRYNFTIPDLPPGRYRVRVAFVIKGSEESPKIAEGGLQVRPAPGYVPPEEETERIAQPIPLPTPQPTSAEVGVSTEPPPPVPMGPIDPPPPSPISPGHPPPPRIEAPSATMVADPPRPEPTMPSAIPPVLPVLPHASTPNRPVPPEDRVQPVAEPPPPEAPAPAMAEPPPVPAAQAPIDYPPLPEALPHGEDLPAYDRPHAGRPEWLQKAIDVLVGDDLTVVFAVMTAAFVIFAIAFSAGAC